MILGIDEAGRGPWAGPLVVGAVILGDAAIEGLNDSKQLTKKRREALEPEILEKAAATGLGWVSAEEIDEIGLGTALPLATIRAVSAIDAAKVSYDEIIIDGTINFLSETPKGQFVQTLPKADALIPAVSAASIIAKVARDRFMAQQDERYPAYGFGAHAGYGTAKHRAAIEVHGVTPLHRLSFAPLKKYQAKGERQPDDVSKVTSKDIGDRGETAVAEWLKAQGHSIVARNWKNRFCEIDIISRKGDALYFTEVKYRHTASHGDGLAAITNTKLHKMKFAAELYLQNQKTASFETVQLAAASVTDTYRVEQWIPIEL